MKGLLLILELMAKVAGDRFRKLPDFSAAVKVAVSGGLIARGPTSNAVTTEEDELIIKLHSLLDVTYGRSYLKTDNDKMLASPHLSLEL
ncbi:hypothetical protein HAX54_038840 [Datura stramonium]|uniref:Uncharacterized protein n=1 Tax=Datura stramonium TaxID=4076 RepID=A0ABS8VLN3_DATST|nr:hypothetical protein [Datura stramonium]